MSSAMTSTKPAMTQMSQSSMDLSPFAAARALYRSRALRRNHLRIHARPAQSPEKPRVLDLDAMILDHLQPGGLRAAPRFGVAHAELHPQDFRADRDRLLGERRDLLALAEAVDHVHGLRDPP